MHCVGARCRGGRRRDDSRRGGDGRRRRRSLQQRRRAWGRRARLASLQQVRVRATAVELTRTDEVNDRDGRRHACVRVSADGCGRGRHWCATATRAFRNRFALHQTPWPRHGAFVDAGTAGHARIVALNAAAPPEISVGAARANERQGESNALANTKANAKNKRKQRNSHEIHALRPPARRNPSIRLGKRSPGCDDASRR